jgi:Probable N6-adenine methyltransferase
MDNLVVEQEFTQSINRWIVQAIENGIVDFDKILTHLPGVYPSIVLQSLKSLAKFGYISDKVSFSAEKYVNLVPEVEIINYPKKELIKLPTPHPLDYEWRFCESTIEFLIKKVNQIQKTDSLILLGTPSILKYILEKNLPINCHLIDKNQVSLDAFRKNGFGDFVTYRDLTKDKLPNFQTKTVILDPPWYEEHLKLFTWVAQNLCKINGYIFINLPPRGTRPGIESEISNYLNWAKNDLLLNMVKYQKGVISYETPIFERNALKAEGILNFPSIWRRGDLVIFQVKEKKVVERPIVPNIQIEESWDEIECETTRIRIRKEPSNNTYSDPSLISIIKGDILPSVSRRDARRKSVDVWTTGNRVFSCKGKNTLFVILEALSKKESDYSIVEKLKVDRLEKEANIVSNTIKQLTQIFQQEQKEYQNY